tara:strand:+ start:636 stop:1385 length:750 start_codon:yes stop_codon:yes gene_type:complete
MIKNPQKKLFEKIHNQYRDHYYDIESMKYREKFIYKYLFNNINLNQCKVAEIACGSGVNSKAMIKQFPTATVEGFDISELACQDYKKFVECNAYVKDMTKSHHWEQKYDCVMVLGGLHHCINNLNNTFRNIYSMLKPGGLLIMSEPNKQFILQFLREIWYKRDTFFEENSEEALDHDELIRMNSEKFNLKEVKYFGGPAYFLIFNSLILRVPLRVKPLISNLLFSFEILYNKLNYKYLSPAFISQWKKK